MHKYLILLLAVLSGSFLQAQSTLTPNSKIDEVLVYRSGAEVTRTAQVSITSGSNSIKFQGLSRNIDPNSIQISGLAGAQINYVNLERDYLSEVPIPADIKELLDSYKETQFKLDIRKRVAAAYDEEKKLLLANQNILGEDSKLGVADLVQLADLYRTRLKEIELKSLEISTEIEDLAKEVKKISLQLGSWRNLPEQSQNFIQLGLESATAKNLTLSIKYLVYDAGWTPTYDVIAKSNNNQLEWVYKAQVSQRTGVNWDKVNLSFSTGSPTVSGNLPELTPDYVQVVTNRPVDMRSSRANLKETSYAGAAADDMETAEMYNTFDATQGNVNTYFSTENRYSIRSFGKAISVAIDTRTLDANLSYLAVPKVNISAYLSASISNYESLSLLPGEANTYYEGALTGTSYIDPTNTGIELKLPLGRDPQVSVERKAVNDVSKGGNIISSNKKSFHYQIVVKNNKNKEIQLQVQDQVPISKNAEVEVSVLDISGANRNMQTGILTWDLSLAPGASRTLELKYEIKFPKGERINK